MTVINVTSSGVDEISGVTYGGVAMTELAAVSPQYKATGEPTGLSYFYLGSGIPTGAQTVQVTVSGATVTKAAFCRTLTAATDTEIISTVVWNSDALANPTGTLTLSGREAFCAESFVSGQNAVTGIAPLTNWTAFESDLGNMCLANYVYDIVGTANVTVGWTQTSEDAVGFATAVAEVIVAGLPPCGLNVSQASSRASFY